MRFAILLAAFGARLIAQSPPNCTGIALDVDARCACDKDPNSKLCEMVKAGFYEPVDWSRKKPVNLGLGGTIGAPAVGVQPGTRPAAPASPAARPQQARLVTLAHSDYLRVLHPNATLAAGFQFDKTPRPAELIDLLFGKPEGEEARNRALRALQEMDRVWISFAAPADVVVLATGKFEQGAAAGIFYSQGIRPVFLGGAGAMLAGPEASVQAALARLQKPAAGDAGWVTRRAREMARGHAGWIVNERGDAGAAAPRGLQPVRRFALGFPGGGAGIHGEAVTESDEAAAQVAAWIEGMKSALRGKAGAGTLDALAVSREGVTLQFSASGEGLLSGDAGKSAMHSQFGVELYSLLTAGYPGLPSRTAPEEKVLAVKTGMKREDLLTLLGQPLSVYAIQGLDPPRETWSYQVPFGKQYLVRLDGGVVAAAPK